MTITDQLKIEPINRTEQDQLARQWWIRGKQRADGSAPLEARSMGNVRTCSESGMGAPLNGKSAQVGSGK